MSHILVNGYLFSCNDISMVKSQVNLRMKCIPDMNSRAIGLLNNIGVSSREVIFSQLPARFDDQSIISCVDVELSSMSHGEKTI